MQKTEQGFLSQYNYITIQILFRVFSLHKGENRKMIDEWNVEKTLADLLMQENESVRTAACQAVATVSKNLPSRDTFRSLGNLTESRHTGLHTGLH